MSTAINGAGNAIAFTAGATSFGTGSGSHTSLADLKIVPGQAVLAVAWRALATARPVTLGYGAACKLGRPLKEASEGRSRFL